MVRERFTSRVTLDRPDRIDVNYTEGPFRYLDNHWMFERAARRLPASISSSISSSARACCKA